MKRKSNILSNVLPIFISCLFVLGIIAGLVAVLKKFADGGFNDFTVTYEDTVYTQDIDGIAIDGEGVFTITYKETDTDDIKVKLLAVELYEDFYFQSEDKKYSWNANVARSKIQNFTECFDITIDNKNNTVTVKGSLTDALKKAGNTDDITLISTLPNEDMFSLEITSGDTTIYIGCIIRSSVAGIELSQSNIYFE